MVTPIGVQDVFDFAVEDVNHYITDNGIVNRNCFDEISHFTRSQYRFIIGWNRTDDPSQRCRVICAGNPPTTPEGRWVVEEWAPWLDSEYPNPAEPGELRWYSVLEDKLVWLDGPAPFYHKGERVTPKSRTFIPARVQDNPVYMTTGYVATLQAMPEPLRSQMLYGDFQAGTEDDAWQVIPTEWIRAAQRRWKPTPPEAMSCLGVDVARGGKDKTVLSPRHGPWFAKLYKHPGSTTPDGDSVAALAIRARKDDASVYIDAASWGASAYDALVKCEWFETVGVNNAHGTKLRDKTGKFGFTNVRAASYWKLREALHPVSGENLALPPDNELVADLCAPRYKLLSSGYQVEKKDDIIKRIGRSPDCFIAGTPVLTSMGNIPVEEVSVGMLVWTRLGWRRVAYAGQTYAKKETVMVTFSDGRILRGTPSHPVYIQGKGFIPLDSLVLGDRIEACKTSSEKSVVKPYSSKVLNFGGMKDGNTSIRFKTATASRGWEGCIRKFGEQLTGLFQKGRRSITRTAILGTTILAIWSALRALSIVAGTLQQRRNGTQPVGTRGRQLLGIAARRVLPGIPSTARKPGRDVERFGESAFSARRSMSPRDCGILTNSAAVSAGKNGIGETRPTLLMKYVQSAARSLSAPLLRSPEPVRIPVRQSGISVLKVVVDSPAPVFNLTVEGMPEYYANGVLVHNCADAVVLAHWSTHNDRNPKRIRVLRARDGGKKPAIRLVACSLDELAVLAVNERALLVHLACPPSADNRGEQDDDPNGETREVDHVTGNLGAARDNSTSNAGKEVMSTAGQFRAPRDALGPVRGASVNGAARAIASETAVSAPPLPPHGCERLLGHLTLTFADIAPTEYQDRWGEPVEPWGKPPAELVMSKDDGRRLWGFLLRKRDPTPEMIVFACAGTRKALSVALSVADVMRLDRNASVLVPGEPDDTRWSEAAPGNQHVYDLVKSTRAGVIG